MIPCRLMIVTAFGLTLGIASCDDSMGPHPWSAFAGKELYASWSGGCYGSPHGVVIYDDGTAHAFIPGVRFTPETLLPVSRVLNVRERAAIVDLIKPFSTFKSRYLDKCSAVAILTAVGLVSEEYYPQVMLCREAEGVPPELYALLNELTAIEVSLHKEEK